MASANRVKKSGSVNCDMTPNFYLDGNERGKPKAAH